MWRFNLSFTLIILLFSLQTEAQCKRFHRTKCEPTVPETHVLVNQFMLSNFYYGDEATVNFTVVPAKNYLLNLCAQSNIVDSTYFTIAHESGAVFYDSREHNYNSSISFSSESADRYILSVKNEKPRKGEIIPSGCISIVIGMQLN